MDLSPGNKSNAVGRSRGTGLPRSPLSFNGRVNSPGQVSPGALLPDGAGSACRLLAIVRVWCADHDHRSVHFPMLILVQKTKSIANALAIPLGQVPAVDRLKSRFADRLDETYLQPPCK